MSEHSGGRLVKWEVATAARRISKASFASKVEAFKCVYAGAVGQKLKDRRIFVGARLSEPLTEPQIECPTCCGQGAWMSSADNADVTECPDCGGKGSLYLLVIPPIQADPAFRNSMFDLSAAATRAWSRIVTERKGFSDDELRTLEQLLATATEQVIRLRTPKDTKF